MDTKKIKELRQKTGVSILKCKKFLEASDWDFDKALQTLKEQSSKIAEKKTSREVSQGIIASYIHDHRIGVMLELSCETDFVAKNNDFKELANNLAIHIAGTNPDSIESFLEEPYVKNTSLLVKDLIKENIVKLGENILIKRFMRFEVNN